MTGPTTIPSPCDPGPTTHRLACGIGCRIRAGRLESVSLPSEVPADLTPESLGDILEWLDRWDPGLDRFPEFHRTVYSRLLEIPPGRAVSYGELAGLAGRPRAARAAASACARNPIPLRIPCHRVIAADRSLGGFTAGPAWKESLLRIEAAF